MDNHPVKTDVDGNLQVDVLSTSLDAVDFATETTLAGLKTDFESVDFATETTLSSLLTESDFDSKVATLATEATAATLLTEATFVAEDFATETTLSAAKTDLDTLAGTVVGGRVQVDADLTGADIEIGAVEIKDGSTDQRATVNVSGELLVRDDDANTTLTTISGLDFATETTLGSVLAAVDDVESKLDTLIAKDYATETTLASFKTDFEAVDFATQTTLATLLTESDFDTKIAFVATEATLETLLTESDFDTKIALVATEATLSTLLTEATFAAEDFATETTLSGIKTDADAISGHIDVDLSTVATEATLSDIKSDLDDIKAQVDKLTFDMDNKLETTAEIETGDIEIGAVEIKDGTTDQRATVNVDGEIQVRDDDVNTTLTTIAGLDFATQTTLSTLLTQADFDSVAATLATEATVSTLLTQVDFDSVAATLATEATLATLALESGGNLEAIKNQTDNLTFDGDNNLLVQEAQTSLATATAVSVDDSTAPATLILVANPARKEVVVVHEDSSNTLYLGFADTVLTTTGIPIVGNQMWGTNKYTGAIYAVAPTGQTIDVRVEEIA
jgi:hypothetical protein